MLCSDELRSLAHPVSSCKMTFRELTQLVALGEGRHLEFKHSVPAPERISKEVIAFANTAGGRLLLGVADDGNIIGVRDAAEAEYALRVALDAHCEPRVMFSTERIEITKKRSVILVSIPASSDKPHYLIAGHTRTAYVRVDEMSVEASREAIRLMRTAKNPDDVLFEFGEKEQTLMRYLDSYGRISVEQFANLVNIPPAQASNTLVVLARANVLQLHADPKEDYFTLAYNLTERS